MAPTPLDPFEYVEAARAAAVATLTESLTFNPDLTASTYALVAASCACVGSATSVNLFALKSIV